MCWKMLVLEPRSTAGRKHNNRFTSSRSPRHRIQTRIQYSQLQPVRRTLSLHSNRAMLVSNAELKYNLAGSRRSGSLHVPAVLLFQLFNGGRHVDAALLSQPQQDLHHACIHALQPTAAAPGGRGGGRERAAPYAMRRTLSMDGSLWHAAALC